MGHHILLSIAQSVGEAQHTGIMKSSLFLLVVALALLGEGFCQTRQCRDGQYFNRRGNRCLPCRSGRYGEGGRCFKCPAGTFAPVSGATECMLCPAGTYQDREGRSSCKDCRNGGVGGLIGAASIDECGV